MDFTFLFKLNVSCHGFEFSTNIGNMFQPKGF